MSIVDWKLQFAINCSWVVESQWATHEKTQFTLLSGESRRKTSAYKRSVVLNSLALCCIASFSWFCTQINETLKELLAQSTSRTRQSNPFSRLCWMHWGHVKLCANYHWHCSHSITDRDWPLSPCTILVHDHARFFVHTQISRPLNRISTHISTHKGFDSLHSQRWPIIDS